MANADRPNGFRPVKMLNGTPWSGHFVRCYSPTDNLFLGDFVEPTATGLAAGNGAFQEVGRAETGDPIVGVVVGWEPNPTVALDRKYFTASSVYAVYVAPCSDLLLEGQTNAAGIVAADVGLNVDFVVAAGDTASGTSNFEVNAATEATTNTLDLRLVQIIDRPDNEIGANMKVLVRVNRDWWANQVAGV